MSAINYSELTYDRKGRGKYIYPDWAVEIGWAMACASVIFIPITMVYQIFDTLRKEKVGRIGIHSHDVHPIKFVLLGDIMKFMVV
jgi:hypothetical protein